MLALTELDKTLPNQLAYEITSIFADEFAYDSTGVVTSTDSAYKALSSLWCHTALLAVGWWSEHIRVPDSKGHIVKPVREGRAYKEHCMHCCKVK